VVTLPVVVVVVDAYRALVQTQTHVAHQQFAVHIRVTLYVYRLCYNSFEQSLIKIKDKNERNN
jgi:hypothetical protein